MSLLPHGLPHHYLKPGEMFFGTEPALVSTLLGSCVSVVMFAPRLRIGAICHGLLPVCRDNANCQCTSECGDGFRYVSCSIRLMLDRFRNAGVGSRELEVKLFGGSDMFALEGNERGKQGVGRQNVEIARQILDEEGIRVMAADTGGARGRKIYFYTHTGEVLMKRLNRRSVLPEQP